MRRRALLIFRIATAVFGILLVVIGVELISASWSGSGFLAGFLLMTGIQVFFWVIGIRLHILGNVTDEVYDSQWEAEASRHTPSAIQ